MTHPVDNSEALFSATSAVAQRVREAGMEVTHRLGNVGFHSPWLTWPLLSAQSSRT